MTRSINGIAHLVAVGLVCSATFGQTPTPKPLLPHVPSAADAARLTLDPRAPVAVEHGLMTNIPSLFGGLHINSFLGADRFYANGFTGQGTVAVNMDGGHVWNGHVTLTHVTQQITGTGALGELDRHATAVGMVIGGRKYAVNPRDHQTGIAPDTDLWSAAIAIRWEPDSPNPRYSTRGVISGDSLFSASRAAFGTADVVNASWGYNHGGVLNPSNSEAVAVGLDGLAWANPRTTLVVVASNGGPTPGSVAWPGEDYNSITVAALGNANSYDSPAASSSRGPESYSDPVRGVIPAARAAVDIAAPGVNITSAYYGGESGGNSPALGGAPGGNPGGPTTFINWGGTSFAAPIVSGAVALLNSASYGTPALMANPHSRDARVVKAVLLNSAAKTAGWDNGQRLGDGVVVTEQALDYAVGAGRVDLDRAYDQYLAGTRDLSGTGGGVVGEIGWDFAAVGAGAVNDYPIAAVLKEGTTFNATVSWFRKRTFTDAATVSDDAYQDLDLEIWDGDFSRMVATSRSRYENVEHLSFEVPETGLYALRVRHFQTLFGAEAPESYGLAWSGTAGPGGDANLDGRVDIADYFAIDRGRAMGMTGWENGDLNLSGGVADADDYVLMDQSFLEQMSGTPAGAAAGMPVPEPGSTLPLLAALAIARRRLVRPGVNHSGG